MNMHIGADRPIHVQAVASVRTCEELTMARVISLRLLRKFKRFDAPSSKYGIDLTRG